MRGVALVPAYFDPIGPGLNDWNRMLDAAQRIAIIAVANPNDGPGQEPEETYRETIRRASLVGIRVTGYVATDYSNRPAAQVYGDIDRWTSFYPEIAGIFFDEQTASDEGIPFYKQMFSYARDKINDALIIGNPGLLPSERYISEAQADIECVFESDTGFGGFTPADWMANYPADRFCALPLGVASTEAMKNFLLKALNEGIGNVYVTDDTLPNPWDRLPSYWDREVEALIEYGQ
jgi:hypothetical protein